MPPPKHPRQLFAPTGTRLETAAAAAAITAALPPERVLWVDPAGRSAAHSTPITALLGQTLDAIILDTHDGTDPDVLAAAHGFIRDGGALILRRSPTPGRALAERLAALPYTATDVSGLFERRVARWLAAHASPNHPIAPPTSSPGPTPEQDHLVTALATRWARPQATWSLVLADRGRGKSAALGRAVTRLGPCSALATAPTPAQAATVLAFAPNARFVPLDDLLTPTPLPAPDLLLIDEAAAIALPALIRLAARFPHTHLAWASTTGGYEGTGRGLSLRFLPWLRENGTQHDLQCFELTTPIRWGPLDPLEHQLHELLVLSTPPPHSSPCPAPPASPASAPPSPQTPRTPSHPAVDARPQTALSPPPSQPLGTLEPTTSRSDFSKKFSQNPSQSSTTTFIFQPQVRTLTRGDLASPEDETLLTQAFALLVHAHYRTTPSDLWRLMDAPNLHVHAVTQPDQGVIATTLVAEEGGLDLATIAAVHRGTRRLRAHALADVLITHLDHPEAGALKMLRSVRIATHPDLRRTGLGRQLVEHVHATAPADTDLIGTVFGATAEVIAFRRSLGYELVRISASRGARTGEPAAVMLHPRTPPAHALMTTLRAEFARSLPHELALLQAESHLDSSLCEALAANLPTPAPSDLVTARHTLQRYLDSTRTVESIAWAARTLFAAHPELLERAPPQDRRLIEARLLRATSWHEAAQASGLSIPAAQRAMRRALAGC